MTVTVRPIAAEDHARWRVLWQSYLEFYEENNLPEAVTQHLWQNLLDADTLPHGLVAVTDDGAIAGFVHFIYHSSTWSMQDSCYLEDLFVDANTRNSGAGRALIAAVGETARTHGCKSVYWKTHHHNSNARKLYDKVADLSDFVIYEQSL